MRCPRVSPWRRDSNEMASGKPGAVQFLGAGAHSVGISEACLTRLVVNLRDTVHVRFYEPTLHQGHISPKCNITLS